MSAVAKAALLVSFPVVAATVGSTVAAVRRPGPRLSSGIQHLAAGVVFAAVATEVLPDLRRDGRLGVVVVGFSVGVVLLLSLGAFSDRLENAGGAGGRVPWGLLIAVGIDLLIDGLLVGLGATLGSQQGVVLTVALTLEILFLGVSVCATLLERGLSRVAGALVASSLGLATAIGAVGGAAVLGGAGITVRVAVLAFGAAALLYLVVEELLVEAHEQAETPVLAGMFFVGFLGLYVLAGLGG